MPKEKKPKFVEVSDHAIVRYMERVLGMDINAIRREIVPERVKKIIATLGGGKIPVNNEFSIRVFNNTVVTVLPTVGKHRRNDGTKRGKRRNG